MVWVSGCGGIRQPFGPNLVIFLRATPVSIAISVKRQAVVDQLLPQGERRRSRFTPAKGYGLAGIKEKQPDQGAACHSGNQLFYQAQYTYCYGGLKRYGGDLRNDP